MLKLLVRKLWRRWLLTELEFKLLFLCLSSAFLSVSCILLGINPVATGIFLLLAVGLYFAWMRLNQGNSKSTTQNLFNKVSRPEDRHVFKDEPDVSRNPQARNITVNGNYNENIEGDCITVHGNLININQDLEGFIDRLKTVLEESLDQKLEPDSLREKIIGDLEKAARRNPKFRGRLRKWKVSLSKSPENLSDPEAAKALVDKAEEMRWNAVDKEIEFDEKLYDALENYLREGAWEDADTETVKVIIQILSSELGSTFVDELEKNQNAIKKGNRAQREMNLYGLSEKHIAGIPASHLRHINRLWSKYSDGRFGFSAQKRIAQELAVRHLYGLEYLDELFDYWFDYPDNTSLGEFGSRVGWCADRSWIFISDFIFSIKEPPGHLPFQLYLSASSANSYRIRLCTPILRVILNRLYD